MANTKISALSSATSIADDDVFPMVDTSETATKKVAFSVLRNSQTKDYLIQSNNTDQAISASGITSGQIITFDTDVSKQGFTRTSSRFTCSTAGEYLICFSGLVVGTINKKIAMWLRSGTGAGASSATDNVINSTTYYSFKSTGGSGIIAVAFIQTLVAGQWFEFWTWGDDTSSTWDYTAAVSADPGVTPARPACPSIIITANRI